MLIIVGKILGIIGLLLLILLGCLLVALLLVLFFPVTYRVRGERDPAHMEASLRMNWLFGVLRLRYAYPDPGKVVVKILWFTLYDSAAPPKKAAAEKKSAADPVKDKKTTPNESPEPARSKETEEPPKPKDTAQSSDQTEQASQDTKTSPTEGAKKIVHTVRRICDKLKQIWTLLQEDETKGLLAHVKLRIGKLLWGIRPRKLEMDLLYGTGSPDTTGYLYGVYGVLSPKLGSHVQVTPDFTQPRLEGKVYAAGHITVIHLLYHTSKLLLDKRLRSVLRKAKQLKTS